MNQSASSIRSEVQTTSGLLRSGKELHGENSLERLCYQLAGPDTRLSKEFDALELGQRSLVIEQPVKDQEFMRPFAIEDFRAQKVECPALNVGWTPFDNLERVQEVPVVSACAGDDNGVDDVESSEVDQPWRASEPRMHVPERRLEILHTVKLRRCD